MTLQVQNTIENSDKAPVILMAFGSGGVGKTTFATTAPNALIVDCEGGTKYLGKRGIAANVVNIKSWSEMKDVISLMENYDTIVIDPIGELMEKLKRHMTGLRDKKLTMADGSPTIAGWGWLKENLRSYLKILRDSGKHVVIIAHVEEKADGDIIVKRPLVQTKLSEDLVNMVDVVAYMTRVSGGDGEDAKRVLLVDADSERYVAKDRTGQLGKVIEPDFKKIVAAIQGTEIFAWSSDVAREAFAAKTANPAPKDAVSEPEAPAEEPSEEPAEEGLTPEQIEEEMNPKKTAAKKAAAKPSKE